MQLCGSLSILWHWNENLTFSSPVAATEFSKFADILSAILSQHHFSRFIVSIALFSRSLIFPLSPPFCYGSYPVSFKFVVIFLVLKFPFDGSFQLLFYFKIFDHSIYFKIFDFVRIFL